LAASLRWRNPAGCASRACGGYALGVRFGNVEVRPLGGAFGCLLMILVSILLSVALTLIVNLIL